MPGDVLNLEVYAKYVDSNTSNWTSALSTLMGQVTSGTSGVVIDGASYASSTSSFSYVGLLATSSSGSGPKAYLNWLIFDRNFMPVDGGFIQMTTTAKEHGQDVAHEFLSSGNITIKQPGYVYVYLSNEETSPVEVYFDDFKVTHTKNPVIETSDYYPFGLVFNNYARENSVPNRKKFQGQEHIDDLGLNWDSFKWRNYQPEIGRFFNVDPLAEKYVHNGTYAFAENKVITFRELEGLEGVHYMDGNDHVVEKNVVVLLENRKTAKEGATAKEIKKVDNQNRRIDARNTAKLASVASELNNYYNGSDGKGSQNSKGENVHFKFNVTGVSDINKKGMSTDQRNAIYAQIGLANGIQAKHPTDGSNIIAPAAVLTTEGSGGDQGKTTGASAMRLNFGAPEGATSHEVLHTLGLPDNGYNKGGLLNSPPHQISDSEVDGAIKYSYDKK
jgi:RHS repeat-associated protein